MKCNKGRLICLFSALLIFSTLLGCSPPMMGTPSFTLLSDKNVNDHFTPLGKEVEESDCFTWTAIFAMVGHVEPSTEGVVSRTLDKYQADVLLNAELTRSGIGIPYIYMRFCENVKGIPAKYAGGAK